MPIYLEWRSLHEFLDARIARADEDEKEYVPPCMRAPHDLDAVDPHDPCEQEGTCMFDVTGCLFNDGHNSCNHDAPERVDGYLHGNPFCHTNPMPWDSPLCNGPDPILIRCAEQMQGKEDKP